MSDQLPDQGWRPTPSLMAKVADELRRNDECGPGPLSDDEYMDDARAILRIVDEHKAVERDRLRAENERYRDALEEILDDLGARRHIRWAPNYPEIDHAVQVVQMALECDQ